MPWLGPVLWYLQQPDALPVEEDRKRPCITSVAADTSGEIREGRIAFVTFGIALLCNFAPAPFTHDVTVGAWTSHFIWTLS